MFYWHFINHNLPMLIHHLLLIRSCLHQHYYVLNKHMLYKQSHCYIAHAHSIYKHCVLHIIHNVYILPYNQFDYWSDIVRYRCYLIALFDKSNFPRYLLICCIFFLIKYNFVFFKHIVTLSIYRYNKWTKFFNAAVPKCFWHS